MKLLVHITHEKNKNAGLGNVKGRDHLGGLSIGGTITLKLILKLQTKLKWLMMKFCGGKDGTSFEFVESKEF
jgi:hypothetical protein